MAGEFLTEKAWDLGKKHAKIMFVSFIDGLRGKGNESEKSGEIPDFKVSISQGVDYSTGQWRFPHKGNMVHNLWKPNPRLDLTLGSEQIISLQYQNKKYSNGFFKGAYDINRKNLDLGVGYKFGGVLDIDAVLHFEPRPYFGGSLVIDHQCLQHSTKIKPRGASIKGGLRLEKGTKLKIKGKHSSANDASIIKGELERVGTNNIQWYSLNTKGVIKAKIGAETPNGFCKLKAEFNVVEKKAFFGLKCSI